MRESPTTRTLVANGDSADIRTWSNIPYFLFNAAKPADFLSDTVDTSDPWFRYRSLLYSLKSPLRLELPGGYQLSADWSRRMWERIPQSLRGGEFISHFQLFPPLHLAERSGSRHSFYCDATLTQLFSAKWPRMPRMICGARTLADAMARERELYHSSRFFIGMARATVQSAINDYGVDPRKAYVVRAGANLDESIVQSFLARRGASWRETGEPFSRERPARLGFIGRDYERKGLPRLIEAAQILHSRGRPVRVTIIGNCPEQFRAYPNVEWRGFIQKATHMRELIEAIDTFAIGCLPSYAEPLGISTLEAIRLGVPVMGTHVGGIPDCVPADAGFILPADVSGEGIADAIETNVFDAGRYDELQRGAVSRMNEVTWARTVEQLIRIWETV
ncbi:MAG TPA: glycosyltransferase family 4 protein [Tepidisphaeraceae bacterium]|nr:glycosyltransferase family 4 protein [Tepidisphaeraceae bacterium]